jgi:hypothetical protein
MLEPRVGSSSKYDGKIAAVVCSAICDESGIAVCNFVTRRSLSRYCCNVHKIKMPNNVMQKLLISNFTKILYKGYDTTEKLYLCKCKIDRILRLKYG